MSNALVALISVRTTAWLSVIACSSAICFIRLWRAGGKFRWTLRGRSWGKSGALGLPAPGLRDRYGPETSVGGRLTSLLYRNRYRAEIGGTSAGWPLRL